MQNSLKHKISIYTQISPRLEVFFLKEWIEHHLMLGVDKIHLYDNGFVVIDPKYNKPGRVWKKKSHANYFFEYSDAEIKTKLGDVVESFGEKVSIVDWQPGKHSPTTYRTRRQVDGYRHCVTNNQSDWWIHIDPDEYIISKKYLDLKEFISAQDTSKYSAFVMGQRVFDARTTNHSTRSITWCHRHRDADGNPHATEDLRRGMTKSIICGDIKKFDAHRSVPAHGLVKLLDPTDLMYHHYRGGWWDDCKNLDDFEKARIKYMNAVDDSMIKFLKKHGREI